MSFGLSRAAFTLLLCSCFCGCIPGTDAQLDEQKNPFLVTGRERVNARDYKGAIEAFEKAVELNPRSALAHFELGVLYEQYSEQREMDFVAAIYHYHRTIQLRPNGYPADNAKERISGCKRELVKAESLAPVYQLMQRELEKLREENRQLRKQCETTQGSPGRSGMVGQPNGQNSGAQPQTGGRTALPPDSANDSRAGLLVNARERTVPPGNNPATLKTHTVKAGETLTSIARLYRVKVESVTAANPAVEPKRLKVGQSLNIPSS